ncbi:MAG: hypothetical protein ABEJ79_02640 [Halolamina sp.]
MSFLDPFTTGLGFRSTTPSFDAGEEFEAFVTGREDGDAVVRVGDTRLRLNGTDPDTASDAAAADRVAPDTRVHVRVTRFDDDEAAGDVELVAVLDDG